MAGLHFHPLRVAALERDGDDATIVAFEPLPPELAPQFRFAPGQYLTLRAAAAGGDELRRSYSICAAPGEPLRVGVRHVPGGAFSSWLLDGLEPGDTIDAMQPQGRFGAALDTRPRHLLAVAGGSGITPILSILKAAFAADPNTRCTLLYGNRTLASTMFKEELQDLKNRHLARFALHAVFSREVVDTPLHAGRLDGDRIAAFMRLVPPVDQAFVCGPHALNDDAEAALRAAGLAAEQVHVERFGVPPALDVPPAALHAARPGDAAVARIVVERDGALREVPFGAGDDSILAAASRAGIDVPYACKSGVCATCRAKLVDGEVRMDRNFALAADDLAAGFVLTCQAHPLTARVHVSFDHR